MAVSDEVRPARPRPRTRAADAPDATDTATLDAIANRILWLAVRMIHEANHVRPSTDGIKVGGHQASSASVVSILTALYFRWLRRRRPRRDQAARLARPTTRSSTCSATSTPRCSPGCASSAGSSRTRRRTKDPDPVDFSTGSVGLGAVAPMFAALADRYLRLHFRESIAEPAGAPVRGARRRRRARRGQRLGGDPRGGAGRARQRHDDRRPQPPEPRPGRARHPHPPRRGHVRGGRLARHRGEVRAPAPGAVRPARAATRCASGSTTWRTRTTRSSSAGRAPSCASGCSRAPPAARRDDLARNVRDVPDDDLPRLIGDLGGHDQVELERAFRAADAETARPTVDLRLHDQGLAPAVRRRQPQPLGAPRARPGRPARARPRHRPRRRLGGLRARLARGPAGEPPRGPSSATTRRARPISPRRRRPTIAMPRHPDRPRRPAPSRRSATRSPRSPATRRSAAGS